MPYKDPKKRKECQRQKDAKRAGRTRNYTAVMYPDDLPKNWKELIDDTHVKWIESPLHDKDLNPDGQPKKIHHHTLFMFENVKTLEQVKNYFIEIFGESETGSIIGVATPQTVSDKCALVRYFAHLDNPSKAQYDVADIIGHNGADVLEIMRRNQSETIEMMQEIHKFIIENNITEYSDLCMKIEKNHEWFVLVVTRNTIHFNSFINSRRNIKKGKEKQQDEIIKALEKKQAKVNENGEIVVDE